MARRIWTGNVEDVALTASTAETVMQYKAGANHAAAVRRISVGFDGTTYTNEAVLVELLRQTTAGTMSALTPVKGDDSVGDSADGTWQHTATAEPTGGDVLRKWRVPPTSSMEIVFPIGDDEPIVGAGDYVGIRCTADNDVNVTVSMSVEE